MRRNTRLRYPGGWGVLWGVLAYAAGLVATHAVVADRADRLLASVTVGGAAAGDPTTLASLLDPPAWRVSTMAFYNAHLASTMVENPAGDLVRRNLVTAADWPALALVVVPPLALAVAGVAVTRSADESTDLRFDIWGYGWRRYAVNGGLVTLLGYAPPCFLGSGFATMTYAGGRATLDPVGAWFLAGLGYPLVFGGLGGVVVWFVRQR